MRLLLAILLPAVSSAAIWPENFGSFHRVSAEPVTVSNRPLWDEYGLQQAERAEYESGLQRFSGTAWRFQDSTGAMGAFEWQLPPDGKLSKLGALAVETPKSTLLAHGSYLLLFNGRVPEVSELEELFQHVPRLDQSPLPALRDYLPSEGLIPNSQRYVTGPVGLQMFAPVIPPSTAAFHFGAEAQMGAFKSPGGPINIAIFSYPTPQIAIQRVVDFQRISGATAKRTGPLVAVVLPPANPDDAERLLAQVRYQPSITWSERVPTRRDNIGDLVINAFLLIGMLLIFCVVAGVAVGAFRTLFRRAGPGGEAEPVISLHLGDR